MTDAPNSPRTPVKPPRPKPTPQQSRPVRNYGRGETAAHALKPADPR